MKGFLGAAALMSVFLAIGAYAQNPAEKSGTDSPVPTPKIRPVMTNEVVPEIKPSKEPWADFTPPSMEILGPPVNFQASAYALRGITASGIYVRRGVIAADPRVIPIGSVVHIETPGYSGVYTVADSGRVIRGKTVDVGLPSPREASTFGRRQVKLSVLRWGPKAGILRRGLETARANKEITEQEYRLRDNAIRAAEEDVLAKAVSLSFENAAERQTARYAPTACGDIPQDDPIDVQLALIFADRVNLEIDFASKLISEAKYEEQKMRFLNEEIARARRFLLPQDKMQEYYASVAAVSVRIVRYEKAVLAEKAKQEIASKKDERPFDVKLVPIMALVVALIGSGTGCFFGWSKYRAEVTERRLKELQIQELQRKLDEQSVSKLIIAA